MIQELLLTLRDALSGSSAGAGSAGAGLIVALLAIVVLLVIAGLVLFVLRGTSRSGRIGRRLAERSRPKTAATGSESSTWVFRAVIILVFVGAVLAADNYMGRDSTCLQCHKGSKEAAALKSTVHASTGCNDCHQPAGVTGGIRRALNYSRMVYVFSKTHVVPKTSGDELVENSACLRCHRSVSRGVSTANGIRVRHSDFLERGAKCTDCHTVTTHPDVVAAATRPTMDKCTRCHDGKTASRECTVCHTQDVALDTDISQYTKVPIAVTSRSCYRCHAERGCTSCHGVLMPHPEDWMKPSPAGGPPGHARDGFVQRQTCFRCHFAPGQPFVASNESCTCHGLLGRMHGGEPWVKEHGLQATGQKPGSNARCFDCHTSALCSGCHPESYLQRYNPVSGEDSYQRDIPIDPLSEDW